VGRGFGSIYAAKSLAPRFEARFRDDPSSANSSREKAERVSKALVGRLMKLMK
jgi:hypothetical protein